MSMAENIKALRTKKGIDQKELGKLLGITGKTISSWECGRTEPRAAAIAKMAEIFGCSQHDIITGGNGIEVKYDSRQDYQLARLMGIMPKLTERERKLLVDYAAFLVKNQENEENDD